MATVLALFAVFAVFSVRQFILPVESVSFQSRYRKLETRKDTKISDEFMIVPDQISMYEIDGYLNVRPFFKLYSPDRPQYTGLGVKPNASTVVTLDWIVDGIPFKNLANGEGISWEHYPYVLHTGVSFANPRIRKFKKRTVGISISMVHTDFVKRPGDPEQTDEVFRSAVSLLINFKLRNLKAPKPRAEERFILYNMSIANYTFRSSDAENTIEAKVEFANRGDHPKLRHFHADFKGFDVTAKPQRTIRLINPGKGRFYLPVYDIQVDNGKARTRSASAKITLNSGVAERFNGILKTGFTYSNDYCDVKVTFDATTLLSDREQSKFGLFGKPVGSFFGFFSNGFDVTLRRNKPAIIPCFAVGYPLRELELHKFSGNETVKIEGFSRHKTSFDSKYERFSFLAIRRPKAADAGKYVCSSKVNVTDTYYLTFKREFNVDFIGN